MTIFNMKGRILVGVGIFVGLLLLFYSMVYHPKIEYKNDLQVKISQQSRKLVQLRKKFQELEELREENKKIKEDLSFLEKRLKEGRISFLHELGVRGKIYAVEYLDITPLTTVEEEYYWRTPVRIHLYGKYHNLGMLLSDMAKRGGLGSFTVDSVLLKSTSGKDHTVEANLVLSLYKYKQISAVSSESSTPGEIISSEVSTRRER